jgi:hypothetical protein
MNEQSKGNEMIPNNHIQQEIADACGVSRGRIAHYIGDVLPRGTKGTRNASA